MIGLLVLLFPLLLLGFMLFMARVEEPLDRPGQQREIENFLDGANRDEIDAFVREGVDSGLRRFRNRVRRLRPSARRRVSLAPPVTREPVPQRTSSGAGE